MTDGRWIGKGPPGHETFRVVCGQGILPIPPLSVAATGREAPYLVICQKDEQL